MMHLDVPDDVSGIDQCASDAPDEHTLNPIEWTCSCIFNVTRHLPCRHIIYYRKITHCKELVPAAIIQKRWVISNFRNITDESYSSLHALDSFTTRTLGQEKNPTPSRNVKSQDDKFKHLLQLGKEIAEVGCLWGSDAHNKLAGSIEMVLNEVKKGRLPRFQDADKNETFSQKLRELVDIYDGLSTLS